MKKNISKLFNTEVDEHRFNKIKITLASPEKINLGLLVKLKNQKQ